MGRLLGIAVREAKRAPMEELQQAYVSKDDGIFGDFRGGKSKKRQVTILTHESWREVLRVVRHSLPWTTRRANLFVHGLVFSQGCVGKCIQIGHYVVLEITSETTPCQRMDEAHHGLYTALMPQWRGGVTCTVMRGGVIHKNDLVAFVA